MAWVQKAPRSDTRSASCIVKANATANTHTEIQPARGVLAYQLVIMAVVRVALPPVVIHEPAQMGADTRGRRRGTNEMRMELSLIRTKMALKRACGGRGAKHLHGCIAFECLLSSAKSRFTVRSNPTETLSPRSPQVPARERRGVR